jgi:hypothetical protein
VVEWGQEAEDNGAKEVTSTDEASSRGSRGGEKTKVSLEAVDDAIDGEGDMEGVDQCGPILHDSGDMRFDGDRGENVKGRVRSRKGATGDREPISSPAVNMSDMSGCSDGDSGRRSECEDRSGSDERR